MAEDDVVDEVVDVVDGLKISVRVAVVDVDCVVIEDCIVVEDCVVVIGVAELVLVGRRTISSFPH